MTVTIYVFTYFGGFTTGKSLDVNEFKAYAKSVDEISIPQEYNIIALGEATHGNKEFQQLKLEVFKKLVEEHRVHSFALEGDFGGCEEVNQYIEYSIMAEPVIPVSRATLIPVARAIYSRV